MLRRLLLSLGMLALPVLAHAQALVPIISGPEDIAVGRTIVLEGSLSKATDSTAQYRWYILGKTQPISETVEAVYTPERPGTLIFRLVVTMPQPGGGKMTSEVTHAVNVYVRKITLVADATVPADKLTIHRQVAADAGVFLRVLQPSPSTSPLSDEEALAALLSEQSDALLGANVIVFWTEGIAGLQSLLRSGREETEEREEVCVMVSPSNHAACDTLHRVDPSTSSG